MNEYGTVKGHSHRAGKPKGSAGGKNGPVRIYTPDAAAYARARVLAGGNIHRLFTVRGGAVIVTNTSRRPKWVAKLQA